MSWEKLPEQVRNFSPTSRDSALVQYRLSGLDHPRCCMLLSSDCASCYSGSCSGSPSVTWRTWGDVGCFLEEGTRIAKGFGKEEHVCFEEEYRTATAGRYGCRRHHRHELDLHQRRVLRRLRRGGRDLRPGDRHGPRLVRRDGLCRAGLQAPEGWR